MAITDMNSLVSGFLPPVNFYKIGTTMEAAGVTHSYYYSIGMPGKGIPSTAGLAGEVLSGGITVNSGNLPFWNGTTKNTHLAGVSIAGTSQTGILYLVDRLWHNSGIVVTTTTAQTINSVAWPSRCPDVTNGPLNTSGFGVMVGLEVTTGATTNGASTNPTISYTNSAGTSSRTSQSVTFPATAQPGTFVTFPLTTGDVGVKSIESITLGTTLGAGTVSLVAYRIIATIPIITTIPVSYNFINLGMPRIYDNSYLTFLFNPANTTATNLIGNLIYTQN